MTSFHGSRYIICRPADALVFPSLFFLVGGIVFSEDNTCTNVSRMILNRWMIEKAEYLPSKCRILCFRQLENMQGLGILDP